MINFLKRTLSSRDPEILLTSSFGRKIINWLIFFEYQTCFFNLLLGGCFCALKLRFTKNKIFPQSIVIIERKVCHNIILREIIDTIQSSKKNNLGKIFGSSHRKILSYFKV